MRSAIVLASVLVLVLAVAEEGRAQARDPEAAFVTSLVEAINSKSPERRKALLHPASQACASGQAASFSEEIIARQAWHTVPADHTWKVTELAPDQPLMFADAFDYPVRPTHVLQVDFETAPGRGTSLIIQLARDAGQWREVVGCPKAETLAAMEAAKKTRARRAEQVQALADGTSPELRESVLKLVRQGRRVQAYTHYARVSGQDLTTAKEVVEVLARQAR